MIGGQGEKLGACERDDEAVRDLGEGLWVGKGDDGGVGERVADADGLDRRVCG